METSNPLPFAQPARAIDGLRPLASLVDAFTRRSSDAVASSDPALASALLRHSGERDECDAALRAAWTGVLGAMGGPATEQAAALTLLVNLEKIAELAATLCQAVVDLSEGPRVADVPSLRRLAKLVPDLLRDALAAALANDRSSAEGVLGRGITVDTCFAQAQTDVLEVVRGGAGHLTQARQLHAMGRALERISDGASEIAGGLLGSGRPRFAAIDC
jgi:phosphate uptake regulator